MYVYQFQFLSIAFEIYSTSLNSWKNIIFRYFLRNTDWSFRSTFPHFRNAFTPGSFIVRERQAEIISYGKVLLSSDPRVKLEVHKKPDHVVYQLNVMFYELYK